MQGLKKQVQSQGPWDTASGLLTHWFQQNMLDDFYRRQNDIIDSLMEVCPERSRWENAPWVAEGPFQQHSLVLFDARANSKAWKT